MSRESPLGGLLEALSLRPLGGLFGASGGLLGVSWGPAGGVGGPLGVEGSKCQLEFPLFGPSWGRPGALLSRLGRVWGRLGAL